MNNENVWKHDKLAEDLAIAIGPTPFLNIHLGSVYMDSYVNKSWGNTNLPEHLKQEVKDLDRTPQRADVIKIAYSYTRFCVAIYEIKVSRADFLSDIRSGKWRGYLSHCHRFYFAVAQGVAKKEDIPEEAGLMIRGPKGWQTVKAAKLRDIDIPRISLMSMLFARERKSLRERNINRADNLRREYGNKADRVKRFGHAVAEAMARKEEYDYQARELKSMIKNIRQAIIDGLGLDPGERWPDWELEKLVKQIKDKACS